MSTKPVHFERVIEAGLNPSCALAPGKVLKENTIEKAKPGLPLKSIFFFKFEPLC